MNAFVEVLWETLLLTQMRWYMCHWLSKYCPEGGYKSDYHLILVFRTWWETFQWWCDVNPTSGFMMTSSNGHIFRVIGLLWGESIGHHWILDPPPPPPPPPPPTHTHTHTHKGQWRGAVMFSLICAWPNGWANNRDAIALIMTSL